MDGGALLLALVTLAGLPPLAGFAGEWAVAQALLASARTGGVGHAVPALLPSPRWLRPRGWPSMRR